MSGIKKLAQQTIWYGTSTIVNRMLGYLLTPLLTSVFAAGDFGKITTLFTIAAFMNIVYSFGMETAYFRFISREDESKVYNNAFVIIAITTILFTLFFALLIQPIAALIKLPDHPEYIWWVILIVIFDTMAVLPFAKLRHSGRPVKFAFVKVINVVIQLALVVFFLFICKNAPSGSIFASFYKPEVGVGYVILSNVIASGVTLLLLYREFFQFQFVIDKDLCRQIIIYSLPLLIVGFGGMVNELIDRFVLLNIYPGTVDERYTQSGIYSANYKLAIIIALFIQAFRLGAEPFFFKQSVKTDAQLVYARVMKFFVITCCSCFLLVVLFLDYWKYFMGNRHPEYWTGLKVVPVLLIAKIFLGIYYNLSVWYKLTNQNKIGAWITLGGVVITLVMNFILVPRLGYMGCAIATFCCYGAMMISSYLLGQKYYSVPYDVRRIFSYIIFAFLLFLIHSFLLGYISNQMIRFVLSVVFGITYLVSVVWFEKDEFRQMPVIGKLLS